MADIPDIAAIAGIIGERARASMLLGLMDGRALTATELSRVAGVTKQTASSHLARLMEAKLVVVENIGRHRYFRMADHRVGAVIEGLIALSVRIGATQVETGPKEAALRKARVCYDHLAGDLGVHVYDSLRQQGVLRTARQSLELSADGERYFHVFGIDVGLLAQRRRPMCLSCLDWSVRRYHLAGALGAAIKDRCLALGWARPQKGTRALLFSATGETALRKRFPFAKSV